MRWSRRISDETSVGRAVELYRCALSISAKVDASEATRSNFAPAFRLSDFVSACRWPTTPLRSRLLIPTIPFADPRVTVQGPEEPKTLYARLVEAEVIDPQRMLAAQRDAVFVVCIECTSKSLLACRSRAS